MKILVPTDFSPLSKVAIRYASSLAGEINATVTLIHVAYLGGPPQATLKNLDAQLTEQARYDMAELVQEVSTWGDNSWLGGSEVISGFPVEDALNVYALDHDMDLIVMGTKGAGGLKKVFMGSNAAAMINRTRIPVIAVPAYARYHGIKNILYATDMTAVEEEAKTLALFAGLFGAHLQVLHTVQEEMNKPYDASKVTADLRTSTQYKDISFTCIVNPDVEDGICTHLADTRADMLAMFTHQLSLFEKIMGRSVTREMAFHSWVPVLTMKK